MGLAKYLKKALLNHWNLLAFLGGLGFAAISGHPDVYIPLVMAGEAAYVGVVGTHPKFQRYVDVQEHKESRAQGSVQATEALQRIIRALPPRQLHRFETLQQRCVSLRQLAAQMRAPDGIDSDSDSTMPLEDMQLSGLDRLLWIHLRLLETQTMLERFFESTSEDHSRRNRPPWKHASPACLPRTRRRRCARTSRRCLRTTSKPAVAAWPTGRSAKNSELVEAEIERLENKIRSITEMAINRQDPQFVTGQVDRVAIESGADRATINELQFATGLDPIDDVPPAIIPRGPSVQSQAPVVAEPEPPRRRARQTDDGIKYS